MGAPIAMALARSGADVTVFNRTEAKARALAEKCAGIHVAASAAQAAAGAEVVVLAVKPHLIISVMHEILATVPEAAIVSLAPGISLEQLQAEGAARALRLMPNVAIACGEGMSFICHAPEAADDAAAIASLLAPTGQVAIVEERLFEPAMAVASCGIAYALRYVRAAAEGAVALGIPAAQASAYVARTLRGAAALLESTGEHPEALIDTVTTPGGSTIRGLVAMERAGFSTAVADGLFAACHVK